MPEVRDVYSTTLSALANSGAGAVSQAVLALSAIQTDLIAFGESLTTGPKSRHLFRCHRRCARLGLTGDHDREILGSGPRQPDKVMHSLADPLPTRPLPKKTAVASIELDLRFQAVKNKKWNEQAIGRHQLEGR
jgi:hypothetical protein